MSSVADEVKKLSKSRPRAKGAELAWAAFGCILVFPWILYDFGAADLLSQRRLANTKRFLSEIVPYPLQKNGFSASGLFEWLRTMFLTKGLDALEVSLAISVLAITLAAAIALCLVFFASRRLAFVEYLELGRSQPVLAMVRVQFVRSLALFYRALPEYLWTFILVLLLGVSVWPAIIALALHNAGILTKLYSEAVDDLPEAPIRALRHIGGRPLSVGLWGALPMAANRFLLYYFVRWETCVRESTVIGFLGIVSIGYWIEDARARNYYDELLFFVALGTILVLIGDAVSTITRGYLRRV